MAAINRWHFLQHDQVWVPSTLDESSLSPRSADDEHDEHDERQPRDAGDDDRDGGDGGGRSPPTFSFSKLAAIFSTVSAHVFYEQNALFRSAYCSELFADLEGLDRALHYDRTSFRPLHVRRLIAEEIHRVENGDVGEDRAALPAPRAPGPRRNVAPVLHTIGLPPLHTRADVSLQIERACVRV